jgi:cobalt-zinc-cadmium efflux system outer membrane protein
VNQAGAKRNCALAILLLILTSAGLRAQAQLARQLSLPEALAKAERQNLDLAAARQRRAFARAGLQVARQRPNPVFSFSASRDAPHEGVTLEQPLELGPKRSRRIEVARGEQELTDLEIAALSRQVRHSVRNGFYQAKFAKAVSAQKSELLGLARRLREIAQSRFEAGDVAQLEVIQADLEAARADAELQLARQEEGVAMSRLNALLNEPAAALWDLVSALDALPTAPPTSRLEELAFQSNPDLQHKKQEEAIEQRRLSLLRAERIPDLSVGIGADLNNPPDYQAGLRGQFSLGLPVFAHNQGEIAQSLASQKFLALDLAATKRMIESEVDSSSLEFGARTLQVGIFRDSLVPAAHRLAQMAEESYKAGKANILTVIDAQRNASQVEQEYLDSQVAAQSAFAALEETVGAPLD